MLNLRAFQMLASLGILASIALVFGLVLVTRHMDTIQQDRDFKLVSSQLNVSLESSLQNISSVAKSDEAIRRLDHARDRGWGDRTFPVPAASHLWVYTISFDDSIISGLHGAKSQEPGVLGFERDLPKWVAAFRRDRWSGVPSTAATQEARPVRTLLWSASQLYLLIGVPFSPNTPGLRLTHPWPPLLFLVMPMDTYLQSNLAGASVYDFKIVPGTPHGAVSGVTLSDAAGRIVGSVEWILSSPGGDLRRLLLAPLLLLVGAFTALIFCTYRRVVVTARELVASEARAHYLAFHDELTTLANRRCFIAELERAIASAIGSDVPLSLLLIDLDRFKLVNDNYGHQTGDELIREVGRRLSDICPVGGLCARLGGDEFIILVRGCSEAKAIDFANLVVKSLSEPVQLSVATVTVGGSVGISVFRGTGSGERLIREADLALYRVKAGRSGSAACVFHEGFLAQV